MENSYLNLLGTFKKQFSKYLQQYCFTNDQNALKQEACIL